MTHWKSCERLNNFSKKTLEGVAVGELFFIPMTIAQSSTNLTMRNRAVPETPPLARPRPNRPRMRRNWSPPSIRIKISFMSPTKTARWPAEHRRVSRENCREPAYTHLERIWSRRMPSVRINLVLTEAPEATAEFFFKADARRHVRQRMIWLLTFSRFKHVRFYICSMMEKLILASPTCMAI